MAKASNSTVAKVVTGGHSTRVEGVSELVTLFQRWPEVAKIHLGSITNRRKRGGASAKQSAVRISPRDADGDERAPFVCVDQNPRRGPRSRRGGSQVRVMGYAKIGSVRTGVKLEVRRGTQCQFLVLTPSQQNYNALIARLIEEGMCKTEEIGRW